MNKFEIWILRRILRKAISKSGWHSRNLRDIYALVSIETKNKFSEDDEECVDDWLHDIFELAKIKGRP